MSRAWRIPAALAALAIGPAWARGQEVVIDRPGPPPLESFEADADKDGVPDGGWYNLRDGRMADGGVVGARCLRFETETRGRQARISRAFGVDGRQTEALIIGLWVRVERIEGGERLGDDPGLVIDFLGEGLRTAGRGMLGPWTQPEVGSRWVRVASRIAVPPESRDAIMSVGLLGATGLLEIDGLTIDLVPAGGRATTDLMLGGDFELGDPEPVGWEVEGGARRAFPGLRSTAALELTSSGARARAGLGVTVDRLPGLEITLSARASRLRGAGGAVAYLSFLDGDGVPLPAFRGGLPLFRWSGTFDWRQERTVVPVPREAVGALIQLEKGDAGGWLQVDDVRIVANPDPEAGRWTPYHVEEDATGWRPVAPSPEIGAGSALDASSLVPSPAGRRGFLAVRQGRLAFEKGSGRAQFFGMALLPPTAFLEPGRADALADRLARSGVNLVRLAELDTPLGPGRSLLDDTRDDTQALDPIALARLEHLIAALKARGIYVAIELQGGRRFRDGDAVEGFRGLPPGGGPAAAFDPKVRARALEAAKALLTHVNPETGLPLRDDPVLAWVTLAGELTLFDLIDRPDLLPTASAAVLKSLAQAHPAGTGRKFWQATESAQWRALADDLRKLGVKVPLAGSSHWRRDPAEYVAALAAPGLDLIDDRLFWSPPPWGLPDRRSPLRGTSGSLAAAAARKRHADRPYVVGQWCDHTDGAWALPYEAADLMLAAETAAADGWDALVRRGIFLYPEAWGSAATGTGGGDDIFRIPEVVNGIPQVFALLPHAASILLRGHDQPPHRPHPAPRTAPARRSTAVPGWDPARGRLVIDTPYTQGLAGWPEGQPATFEDLKVDVDGTYAVVVATSMDPRPIASSRRLLVSAVARVQPTGIRWVDQWRRVVADPGRPPLLAEPVRARVTWRRKGAIKAYALDDTGARAAPVALETTPDGVKLSIDGRSPHLHWELVVE